MSALAAIQADFQEYLVGEAHDEPAIASRVAEQFGMRAGERLAIYHRAYRIRMREALCEAFDKTWSYVGDDMFAQLAEGYLAAHPSQHANLRWFGDSFAAYAAQALPDHPCIAELAGLEWALGLAFDACDAEPMTVAQLGQLAPEAWGEQVFCLHPSAQLLPLAWNAVALWQALNEQASPPDAARSAEPVCWLVWRLGHQPHFRSLDALEAQALRQLSRGASFAEVCATADALAAAGAELTLRMAGFLQNWLAQGLLVAPAAPACAPA